jgi:hypothetical protein
MVHRHVHNITSLVSILNEMNPAHTLISYLRSILILLLNLYISRPQDPSAYGFSIQTLYAHFLSLPILPRSQ